MRCHLCLQTKVSPMSSDCTGLAHNVSHVCDAAPSPTRARGRCGDEARRSAEEPEAPSEAPMHIRAVICSCVVLVYPFLELIFSLVS